MYRLSHIFKSYDDEQSYVLNNISLVINKGDFIAITCDSDIERSALFKILAAIERPDLGEYSYADISLDELSNDELASFRNAQLGFIFLKYFLIPEYTVKENILLPTVFNKTKNDNLEEVVEFLGINTLLNKKAKLLTSEEKFLVTVARALINKPELLLVEELSLENENKFQLLKQVNSKGVAVVFFTSEITFSEKLESIYSLKAGELHKQK